jgi:hypothetical protein
MASGERAGRAGVSVERRASSVGEASRGDRPSRGAAFAHALRRACRALTGSTLDARRSTLSALLLVLSAGRLSAQGVDPRGDWRTLATAHFRVHFRADQEAQGRRAAAEAERAWSLLAAELTPPRGPVDLVVADNADFSNGYATPFPSNRIVAYAQPPVDVASLRFYDDWTALLLTHELAHVFHLDRSRGIWRAGQAVFGRHPALFPNAYAPAWLTEGLAVYYESKLTGAGRLVGSEHRLLARAAALDARVPRLDQLSLESSVFPGGQQAYIYGSLVVDYAARHGGPDGVRRLVERTSAQLVPYRLHTASRRALGLSFGAAWQRWRDSVRAGVRADAAALGAADAQGPWRELTREGWYAAYPRWVDGRALLYASNDARNASAAYRVTLDGARERVGRRNSLSPNVPLVGGPYAGGVLFTQLEYADPFTVRGDLWVQADASSTLDFGAAARGQRRLTSGARLAHPDARRADGAIVAVQTVAATTRLVRVSADGSTITPLTRAVVDTQWAEPRWSPDGARLAAVRIARGGRSAIVVLDTLGRETASLGDERAVAAAPGWSADGRTLVWSSDRGGRPQLHAASLGCADAPTTAPCADGGWTAPRRLSDVGTGLTQPSLAPDGATVAALLLRADGQHVVAGALAAGGESLAEESAAYAQTPPTAPIAPAAGPLRGYSPWRSLVPRYWTPLAASADDGAPLLGAATSGVDVLGRHAYSAQLSANVETADLEGTAAYRLRRWARPFIDLQATQRWEYQTLRVQRTGGAVEDRPLDRRTRQGGATLVFARPRYRTSASLSVGALYEARAHRSTLPALVDRADSLLGRAFPSVVLGGAWSNARRPLRSISPEDGVALSFSTQQRWQDGAGTGRGVSRRAIGVGRAYKSLDLPGFAHHVLALRVAGGAADARTTTEFTAGGVSGSSAALLPGITVGDPARTFGVRGFPAGAQRGVRAAAASLEYRVPIAVPARGVALLPVFLDRVSVSAFADAGSTWCPPSIDRAAQTLCRRAAGGAPDLRVSPTAPRWLGAVGAELNLDAALQYDQGYRLRVGLAAPVAERSRASGRIAAYGTLGLAF